MKKIIIIIILSLIFTTSIIAQTGSEVMQNVIDAQKVSSSAMDIQMTLIDTAGDESMRRIQTLVLDENGETKTITIFMEPASIKNTRFLTVENKNRQDDQWIYLPGLRKVKRIAAGEREGSFMGSDFSYGDMASSFIGVNDSVHSVVSEVNYDGYDCFVVQSVPDSGTDNSYGKYISWVDRKTWLTLKVEFYSKDMTKLIKTMAADDLSMENGHWTARKITMETIESGHRTILDIKQVKYDIPVNPAYFTTTFLETGRTK